MGVLEAIDRHLSGLAAALAAVPADQLSGSDAARLVERGVRLARLGTSVQTRYAKRVADTKAYEKAGHRDAVSWLAGVAGESTGAAKGTLELAEKLVQVPLVDQAFSEGKLSPAQAKVVAGAGCLDPAAQRDLIDKAQKDSYRELREATSRLTRLKLGEAAELAKEQRAYERRFLRISVTEHGGMRISGRLTRMDGARIQSVLEVEKQRVFKEARQAGRRTTDEAYLADAFVRVISGEGVADRSKAHVNLHADLAALGRGWLEGDERCEIDGVGQVPIAVARDLLGDSLIELVVRHGTDVKTVTSHKRTIRQPLRTAVWARDGGRCVVPGCGNTRYLEIDHDRAFAEGGPTSLDNLQLLCGRHHKMKTLYGFRMVPGPDGEKRWVGPDPPFP